MPQFASRYSSSARRWAIKHLPLEDLPQLAGDPDPRVRYSVAERLPDEALAPFLDDPDIAVRTLVSARLLAFAGRHVERLFNAAPAFSRCIQP